MEKVKEKCKIKKQYKKTYFLNFNIELLLDIFSVVLWVDSGRKIIVVLRIFLEQ